MTNKTKLYIGISIAVAIMLMCWYYYKKGKAAGGVTNVTLRNSDGELVDIAGGSQKVYDSFGWLKDGDIGLTILQQSTPTELKGINDYFLGNYGKSLKQYADDTLNSWYDWGDSSLYSKVIQELSRMAE